MFDCRYTNAVSITDNWRIDKDGFLLITARVLADGVFDYAVDESPAGAKPINGVVPHYISSKEFTPEALKTLEGKPVIVGEHDWRDAQNTLKDGLTVGNVSGTPYTEDGYIVTDILVTDKAAIDKIINRELVEISAAYTSNAEIKDGVFRGNRFSVLQKDLHFNHVLLLPFGRGRCGRDVKIINESISKLTTENTGDPIMSFTLQRVFNGKNGKETRTFTFSNEDDKKEAEKLADTVKDEMSFDNDGLKAAERVRELNEQLSSLTNERDEAMRSVEELRKKLDELTSSEAIDSLVDEARAQDDATDAILEDAVMNEVIEEKEKEEIKNEVKACNSLKARREKFMELILPKLDMPLHVMNEDMKYGAFMQLARDATRNLARVNNAKPNINAPIIRTPMGGTTAKVMNSNSSFGASEKGLATMMNMIKSKNGLSN